MFKAGLKDVKVPSKDEGGKIELCEEEISYKLDVHLKFVIQNSLSFYFQNSSSIEIKIHLRYVRLIFEFSQYKSKTIKKSIIYL